MSVLMRRENTLIIEPGSDISKIQIINFILLPNSKKHFEGPPLYEQYVQSNLEKSYAEAAPFEAFAAQKQRRNMFPLMNAKGPEIISVLAQVNASYTADV
ncbi:Hypothetical_protein [Hexamita inflata]|uniref:Hypothetical_protein n=1 Tax=Hexamita inflata TaxID=28002 RepID=A0ABP1GE15_9EUKA